MSADRKLYLAFNEDGTLALGGPWAIAEIKGEASIIRQSAGPAAAEMVPGDANRKAAIIQNLSATVTVWLGFDGTVNASTGFSLAPGDVFMDNISINPWWVFATSTAPLAALVV